MITRKPIRLNEEALSTTEASEVPVIRTFAANLMSPRKKSILSYHNAEHQTDTVMNTVNISAINVVLKD